MKPLIDSHIHLQDKAFDQDLAAVINRAELAGVKYLVCNASRPADWEKVISISESHKSVLPFLGIHPWFTNDLSSDWLDELSEKISSLKAGVGECGIDRLMKDRDEGKQELVFREQLRLANKFNRPVSVHCLRAWGMLLDVLKSEKNLPKIMIHAFGGSKDVLLELQDMGCYFSFGGGVLFENRRKTQDALRNVESDRILIETDAPFILPPNEYCEKGYANKKQRRNEPANLPLIVRGLAEIRNEDTDELRSKCYQNSLEFFKELL